jgi:hypothetical protein
MHPKRQALPVPRSTAVAGSDDSTEVTVTDSHRFGKMFAFTVASKSTEVDQTVTSCSHHINIHPVSTNNCLVHNNIIYTNTFNSCMDGNITITTSQDQLTRDYEMLE